MSTTIIEQNPDIVKHNSISSDQLAAVCRKFQVYASGDYRCNFCKCPACKKALWFRGPVGSKFWFGEPTAEVRSYARDWCACDHDRRVGHGDAAIVVRASAIDANALPEPMPMLDGYFRSEQLAAERAEFVRNLPQSCDANRLGLLLDRAMEFAERSQTEIPTAFSAIVSSMASWATKVGLGPDALEKGQKDVLDRRQARIAHVRGLEEAKRLGLVLKPFSAFASAKPEWHVEGVLVKKQLGVIGGPVKTLKTTLAVDLALSVATGKSFLGKWPVVSPCRVAMFSAESGGHTLFETAERVAKAKGLDGIPSSAVLCEAVPRFSDAKAMLALKALVVEEHIGLVIIDPTYQAVGEAGTEAGNQFVMGPLYRAFADACLSARATPLVIHHAVKSVDHGKPLTLNDLQWSGLAECVRQWLLLNRRQPYACDGFHPLLLSIGGSVGQSELVAVEVEEGKLDSDFTGRNWDVVVCSPDQSRVRDAGRRVQKHDAKMAARVDLFLNAVKRLETTPGSPVGFNQVKTESGLSSATGDVLQYLVKAGMVEELEAVKVGIGSGAKRSVRGLRRILAADHTIEPRQAPV